MFDVLIYLFENYLDHHIDLSSNQQTIKNELLKIGFSNTPINSALSWLKSLDEVHQRPCKTGRFRIFSEVEKTHLDLNCRNVLISLEYNGILSPDHREMVIDRAMALENETIRLDELQWIVLLVLFTQSDDEFAYSRMEDIIYDFSTTSLH